MKQRLFHAAALLLLLAVAACNDNDDDKQVFEGSDNRVVSFVLTTAQGAQYEAAITSDRIIMTVPESVSLDGASAAYEICEQAVLYPDPRSISDWDNEHRFRVMAYNEALRDYAYVVERTAVGSEGSVVLLSQSDVEAFAASGATVVEGNLVIGSIGAATDDPVADLTPLAHLTEVRHDIVVNDSFAGTSLAGLEHVVRAGGLVIGTSVAAVALEEGLAVSMPALESLGQLQINCSDVTALLFPKLRSVGLVYVDAGTLAAAQFPALTSCDGYMVLRNTANNTLLASLELPSLERIRGILTIEKYTSLTTLALPKLAQIDGNVTFTTLSAVEELALPELTRCGAFTATNLNSAARFSLPHLTSVPGNFSISGLTSGSGTSAQAIELPLLADVAGDFLLKMGAAKIDRISLPALTEVGGKFDIEYLRQVASLEIPRLTKVGTSFYLYYMDALTELDISRIVDLPRLELIGCPSLNEVDAPAELNDVSMNGASIAGAAITGFKNPTAIKGSCAISGYRCTTVTELTLKNATEIGTLTYTGSGTAGTVILTLSDLKKLGSLKSLSSYYFKKLRFPLLEEVTGTFELGYSQNMGNGDLEIPALRHINELIFNGSSYKNGATQFTLRTTLEDFAEVTRIGKLTIKWWGALADFSGLAKAAASVPEENWTIAENALEGSFDKGYNPTRTDILEGRYTKPE